MKSQNGVTLISFRIYVFVMAIVLELVLPKPKATDSTSSNTDSKEAICDDQTGLSSQTSLK